jgi:phage shock protein E
MKFVITICVFLFLTNCAPTIKTTQNLPLTSSVILKQKLSENPFLVDVRTPEEFAAGSVKGAVNIPLDKVQERISEFKDKKNIVTFCRSGQRSAKAIAILNENGISDVTNGTSAENIKKTQAKK